MYHGRMTKISVLSFKNYIYNSSKKKLIFNGFYFMIFHVDGVLMFFFFKYISKYLLHILGSIINSPQVNMSMR